MALKMIGALVRQAWHPPADPTASFAGRTVLITGSNTGLGLEAATKLAARDADRVILGVRDPAKGARAKASIAARTGCADDAVDVWPLDMADYASVQAFAARAARLPRLDTAILNAGVYSVAHARSAYGWETALQVNTLGTALLAILLLPVLRASAAARRADAGDATGAPPVLEIVGSGRHTHLSLDAAHRRAPNLLQSFNAGPAGHAADTQYPVSKLFVQLVMQKLAALARAADGAVDVLVLSVCPGFARSDLPREHKTSWLRAVMVDAFLWLMTRSTEQGARSIVSGAALGPEAHGRFWQHDVIQP